MKSKKTRSYDQLQISKDFEEAYLKTEQQREQKLKELYEWYDKKLLSEGK